MFSNKIECKLENMLHCKIETRFVFARIKCVNRLLDILFIYINKIIIRNRRNVCMRIAWWHLIDFFKCHDSLRKKLKKKNANFKKIKYDSMKFFVSASTL